MFGRSLFESAALVIATLPAINAIAMIDFRQASLMMFYFGLGGTIGGVSLINEEILKQVVSMDSCHLLLHTSPKVVRWAA